LEPTDRSLHFPATAISSQRSPVLCETFDAVAAVGTNQLNAAFGQPCPQRIAVGGQIVDQTTRLPSKHTPLQKRLDQIYFIRSGAGRVDSQRKTMAVGENHDLRSLAALGLAHLFTPFFADEKVPSAKDSSWATRPCRSSLRSSRAHAFSQMPASVHAFKRRQHVAGEGKWRGRCLQGAPVRRIQRMPSTQGRDATRGRPPFGRSGDSMNSSAIRFHCSSVSSNSGSVADTTGVSNAKEDWFAISDLRSTGLYTAKPPRRFMYPLQF